MSKSFTFNGINSLPYFVVTQLPSIVKAENNIDKIVVPGKDGFLSEDTGGYKAVVKTAECTVLDLKNIDYICDWLDGPGLVTFSNEPDKVYKAVIINQIELDQVIRTFHSFIITFDCQPHKYAIDNDLITLTVSGTSIINPGTANSKPIIKIYGTGDIAIAVGTSPTIYLFDLTGDITMDSDMMDAFSGNKLLNNNMGGEFAELSPGTNTISWMGTVSKIEITPNWRYK